MTAIAATKTGARGAWSAEARATVSLGWPLILTNLAQISLQTTDLIMIGWLGPQALAAGALAFNLYFAFLIFGIGLITATSPLIAIELGRKRHSVRDVRRSVRQGFWAAATIVVPFWIVLWQAEAIFLWMGQDPALARAASPYMQTLQWGILPFLLFVILRNFVSALERPKAALVVGAAAVVVNATLNYILIFGHLGFPALGLQGAGIGTTVTNSLMFAGLGIIIARDRRFRRYSLFGRLWRPDWARYRMVWRIGLPIAAMLAFEVTIFNVAALLMGLIGAEELAAYAVAGQIAAVAFMVPLGLGMAATVRVGLAYGAGNKDGVARAGWTGYAIAVGYACCTAAVMLLAGRPLVGVFLDLDDPASQAVIALAVTFLIYGGLFQLFDATQAVGTGVLRGLGDTRVPMIFAGIGYWGVGMPVGIALGFWTELAGSGIWIGLVLGLAVVAGLMAIRWIWRERLGLTRRDRDVVALPGPA